MAKNCVRGWKKIVVPATGIVLMGGMLFTPLPEILGAQDETLVVRAAGNLSGFQTFGDATYYYVGGDRVYGRRQVGTRYYFFDLETGIQQQGWVVYGAEGSITYYFQINDTPENRYMASPSPAGSSLTVRGISLIREMAR